MNYEHLRPGVLYWPHWLVSWFFFILMMIIGQCSCLMNTIIVAQEHKNALSLRLLEILFSFFLSLSISFSLTLFHKCLYIVFEGFQKKASLVVAKKLLNNLKQIEIRQHKKRRRRSKKKRQQKTRAKCDHQESLEGFK